MFSFMFTRTCCSYSARLLSSWTVSSIYACAESFCSRCRTLPLSLLNLMEFQPDYFSSLLAYRQTNEKKERPGIHLRTETFVIIGYTDLPKIQYFKTETKSIHFHTQRNKNIVQWVVWNNTKTMMCGKKKRLELPLISLWITQERYRSQSNNKEGTAHLALKTKAY